MLKAETGELVVTWEDTFPAETGYRVEIQAASGQWTTVESLPATPGTGTDYVWQRIIDQSATYRVVAQWDGYEAPLERLSGVTTTPIDLPAARAIALTVSEPDPLTGAIELGVQNAGWPRHVIYDVDLHPTGGSATGPSFLFSWDTTNVTDGSHLLSARVDLQQGLLIEVRRPVTVDVPNVAVSLELSGRTSLLTLSAVATSAAGIQSVEFFLNGALIASPAPVNGVWQHLLETQGMPAGTITIKVVATDNDGDQRGVERQIIIDNAPVVTLASPVDGAIVSGSLAVQGTFVDDTPGTSLTISLGSAQVLATSSSPFSTNFSLAGLASGQYTLTLRAVDSANRVVTIRRTVVVEAANAFTFERIGTFSFGDIHAGLLDSEAGMLLYRLPDRTARLRHADGSEIDLSGSAEVEALQYLESNYLGNWQISDNRVAVAGRIGSNDSAVFVFDATGARQVISYTPSAGESDNWLDVGLHGPWLVWGIDRIYLQNIVAQTPVIGPIGGRLSKGHAFIATPGSEQLFHVRNVVASEDYEIFHYDLASGANTQLTSGDGNHMGPKTDGVRVAWGKATDPTLDYAFELMVAPVGNPTALTTKATAVKSFELRDGILAWTDWGSEITTLTVDDGTETVISATTSTRFWSTANGHVVFSENRQLYTWNRAEGRRLLLNTLPKQVKQSADVVFFTLGTFDTTIYRVAL